jgi:hypothetical protein
MTEYKYQLAKRGKHHCPACERKTFVLYINNTTGEPLHATVGKCDRADNCGYHYTPKQYFTDNHISFDTKREHAPRPTPKPQPQPSYIDTDVFKKSLQGHENNNLVQFLRGTVGDEATKTAIGRYYIGTSKNGGTIFWQVDGCERIHAGKIIQYGADGHRRKDVMPPVQWAHAILKLPGFHLSQCLFGEHLLRDVTKMVAIVESEKTAIIASGYLPAFIWLACGGSEGLNFDKCKCLKGREVVLYPDVGMFDKWNAKAEQLRIICTKVSVSNLIETAATETERQAGFDLGDYLIRFSPSEFVEQKQPVAEPQQPEKTPTISKQERNKQRLAYVSENGALYIPTPPTGRTTYTVYPSVEAYNKRSELPTFVPMQSVDTSDMKQVFINLNTLTI